MLVSRGCLASKACEGQPSRATGDVQPSGGSSSRHSAAQRTASIGTGRDTRIFHTSLRLRACARTSLLGLAYCSGPMFRAKRVLGGSRTWRNLGGAAPMTKSPREEQINCDRSRAPRSPHRRRGGRGGGARRGDGEHRAVGPRRGRARLRPKTRTKDPLSAVRGWRRLLRARWRARRRVGPGGSGLRPNPPRSQVPI